MLQKSVKKWQLKKDYAAFLKAARYSIKSFWTLMLQLTVSVN